MFAAKPAPNKFSLQYLKQLHQQLVANQQITPANQAVVIETLRTLSELVVYGESKAELLFDFFCEKNVMALLVQIVKQKCAPAVHTQVIQTISILVQNVRNNTSLYYLLSNNYINEIIDNEFDFRDEELQDHFVSFLKTLSLRLNPNTVQFFFNQENHTFPLLMRAISYVTSSEAMIRVAVQTIILNVYKVEDEGLKQYILQDDVISAFFSQLMALMTKLHNNILTAALKIREESDPDDSIDNSLASFQDQMYYLQDVLSMEISQVGDSLAVFFVAHFVYPVLLKPLMLRKARKTSSNNSRSNSSEPLLVTPVSTGSDEPHEFVIKKPSPDVNNEESTAVIVSLFTILQILSIVSNKQCVVALARALFHPFSVETRARITNSATPDFLPCDPYAPTEERVYPNPYRTALLSLFGEADRFGVLIAAIFEAICSHPALVHSVAQELAIISPECRDASDATESKADVELAPQNGDGTHASSDAAGSFLSEILLQSAAKQHRYSFVTLHLICRSMQYLFCPTLYDPAVVMAAEHFTDNVAGKYVRRDIQPTPLVCKLIQHQLAEAATAMKDSLRGPLGDLFLNLYEDEVRKAAEMDWDQCVRSLESNSYLVMPATKNVLQRLGVAFMVPSSEVERGRRSIQVYMLLRHLDRAVCQRVQPVVDETERVSEARSSFGGGIPSRTRLQRVHDLLMVDEFLSELSGGNPSIQEEQSLEMRGRDCLACSVLAAPTTPRGGAAGAHATEAATGMQRRGSKENMGKTQRGAELYMILDENLLLLATPDRFKLTYGTVKCAVAIHHIDCNIDRQNNRKLQIAARSRRPIGCMRASTTDRKKPLSRNLSYAQPPSATVYQMALLFENEPNCRMAKDHIERHRVRLRAEKMRDILHHLESVQSLREVHEDSVGEQEDSAQQSQSEESEAEQQHQSAGQKSDDDDSGKTEDSDIIV